MSDQPHRPSNLSPYAMACLEALAASGLGHTVSIGGALGLLHYLDYRSTHDVDAWWSAGAGSDDRERVLGVIETTLATSGEVRRRQWGDVVSIELRHEGKTVFSFQIASRSALLRPAAPAPWTDVLLDSLPDLVASKMVALVERGAPRDFRDIHALCQAGLTKPAECWQLWRERQQLGGSDTDAERARLAIQTHLVRIAQHRPLADIADPDLRSAAVALRHWFATEFLDALPD